VLSVLAVTAHVTAQNTVGENVMLRGTLGFVGILIVKFYQNNFT